MQKLIAFFASACFLLSAVLVSPTPASAICASQYPLIGTVGSITPQDGGYSNIVINNPEAYNASTFPTDHTNIDSYNELAQSYAENSFHVPANMQYPFSGSVPSGYQNWADYIGHNYNSISVLTSGLAAASYHLGDIVIQGPPGGGACLQDGFVGFFGHSGTVESAIAYDGAFGSYTYASSTLSLTPGPGYNCSNSSTETTCTMPVTYTLDGVSYVLNPGQSHAFASSTISNVSLIQAASSTPLNGMWIEDFYPISLLHVITFASASSVPPPMSCPTITMTLSLGMTDAQTGGQVTQLQQFLTTYFNLDGTLVVGTFGPRTQHYVRLFQTQNGIAPVGFVGPLTRAAITAVCQNTGQTPPLFVAAPTSGVAPREVHFNASNLPNTNPQNYFIDFGDGKTGPLQTPAISCTGNCLAGTATHIYGIPGTYTAKLLQTICTNSTQTNGSPCPPPAILGSVTITLSMGGIGSGACVVLTHNLFLGSTDAMTGGDVTALQNFLIQEGDMQGPATGYFGPVTMRAVQVWQAANGVVSSGTPDTNGFGYVGPKTRYAMAAHCASSSSGQFSASPTSGVLPLAVTFNLSHYDHGLKLLYGDGASTTIGVAVCANSCTLVHPYNTPGTFVAQLIDGTLNCPIAYDPNDPLSFLNSQTSCPGAVLGTATITVQGGTAGSITLTADATNLAPGGSTVVYWNAPNTTSCTNYTNGYPQQTVTSVQQSAYSIGPLQQTTLVQMKCMGTDGQEHTASLSIVVGQ